MCIGKEDIEPVRQRRNGRARLSNECAPQRFAQGQALARLEAIDAHSTYAKDLDGVRIDDEGPVGQERQTWYVNPQGREVLTAERRASSPINERAGHKNVQAITAVAGSVRSDVGNCKYGS